MKFIVTARMKDGSERKGYVELPVPENSIVKIPGFRSPIPTEIRKELKRQIRDKFGMTKSIAISNA